jgi:hypothetical protein
MLNISPIISQVKRIELISFCFNCKNKELKKSEKVIIPTENYFRDFIGLWDRVLNFIKYIYDIKQTSSIDDVIKNDTVDKKLRNKLKDIKDNFDRVYRIRVDSTHVNSPIEECDEDIRRMISYENLLTETLTDKKLDGTFKFRLEALLDITFKKNKKKYKNLMDLLNERLEKELYELLDIVYCKYDNNLKPLSTVKKTIRKGIS